MLPSCEALIPPHLQTPTRLNSVICQGIPLRCDKLLYTALYTQKPPVLEDPYRWGICRGARGVVEARGHRVPIPKGFATQSSAESSPTSIRPYESSEAIILRCSHTKRTQVENENGWNAIYMKERHRPRSIPIREDLLYSRH